MTNDLAQGGTPAVSTVRFPRHAFPIRAANPSVANGHLS